MRTRRSAAKAAKAADDASDAAVADSSTGVSACVSTSGPAWEPREIHTAGDVLELIECSLNRLMAVPGMDEAMRASKVAQLSTAALKAVELSGLEKAVAELEAQDPVIITTV
jgi:hypothetical protein